MTLLFWFLNNKLALENPASLQCLDDFRKKAPLPGECRGFFILFPTRFQSTFRFLATNWRFSCLKIIIHWNYHTHVPFPQNPPQTFSLSVLAALMSHWRNLCRGQFPLALAFLSPGGGGGVTTHLLPQNFKRLVPSASLNGGSGAVERGIQQKELSLTKWLYLITRHRLHSKLIALLR